jgi:hypothetical protein
VTTCLKTLARAAGVPVIKLIVGLALIRGHMSTTGNSLALAITTAPGVPSAQMQGSLAASSSPTTPIGSSEKLPELPVHFYTLESGK